MGPLAEKEIETVENDLKAGQSFFSLLEKELRTGTELEKVAKIDEKDQKWMME